MRFVAAVILLLSCAIFADAQPQKVSSAVSVVRVKYAGGGDWYNDPSAEVNLLTFFARVSGADVDARYQFVEPGDERLFSSPFLFLTGHGNIQFTEEEARRLRTHLENGGFLYADDDYGMDRAFRREMKKVFPGEEMVELPFTHGIYSILFPFPGGPPKTHEHDKAPPRGYGWFHRGRLVVYYTVESNPSDGWADAEVHGDPEEKRQEALRFGANILMWGLTR